MKRAIILMLDSLGIGASVDADKFGDVGADTFGHIAEACHEGIACQDRQGPLLIPNLVSLGLVQASKASRGSLPAGFKDDCAIKGAYGYAEELSSGKDTPSGHWEIAGVPVLFEWGYFKKKHSSFPKELIDAFVAKTKIPGVLGNCHASGTDIIKQLGKEHQITGKPIVYTSVDSVFQIACHENSFGLQKLYKICEVARELLNPYNIGRVIARPFIGHSACSFERTGNRRDYAVEPPEETVLDKLCSKGGQVISVGKIADIYAHKGITEQHKATGLAELFDKTLQVTKAAKDQTVVFTNFVDFDSSYGHRRDINGYAKALEYFDKRLPELQALLNEGDLLILTADHGCDPSFPGNDHTREHIPVLFSGPNVKPNYLGMRKTFADIGQTLADYFDVSPMSAGVSFKDKLFSK